MTGTFSTTSFVTPKGDGVATATTDSGTTKTGSAATGAAKEMEVGFGGAVALAMVGLLNVI